MLNKKIYHLTETPTIDSGGVITTVYKQQQAEQLNVQTDLEAVIVSTFLLVVVKILISNQYISPNKTPLKITFKH